MNKLRQLWAQITGHGHLLKADAEANELYYHLRMAEDAGVEEGMFCEEERCTGADGYFKARESYFRKAFNSDYTSKRDD